jgi:hypothetical protein
MDVRRGKRAEDGIPEELVQRRGEGETLEGKFTMDCRMITEIPKAPGQLHRGQYIQAIGRNDG